jgi:hypothetical protein
VKRIRHMAPRTAVAVGGMRSCSPARSRCGWSDWRLAFRMATDLPGLPRGRDGAGERGVLTEAQLEATLDVD